MAVMKIYSPGIRISPTFGMTYDQSQPYDDTRAKSFVEHTIKCLDRLKKTSSGTRVIREINASGHVCTIFSAPPELTKDQNVAKQNPPTMSNEMAAQVRPFRPRHKNLLARQKEKPTDGSKNAFVADFKTEMVKLGLNQTMAEAAPELFRVLMNAKPKYPSPFTQLPPLLGISQKQFADMCTGDQKIDDKTYYTLCFLLYDYLTPGPGSSTAVRFQPYDSFKRDFKTDFEGEKVGRFETEANVWRNTAAVILGHELIHAWRIMKGKRVVMGGAWEEEAMTTGVGPFTNWSPTENTIRKEFRMTLRDKYQTGSCASDMMTGIMMQLNWGGVVNERF